MKLDTGWWLTEETLCCQDPWKCQKEMMMFLYIFLNASFESVSQMLSLESNVLQDDALFLAQLCLCPPFRMAGAGKPGASNAGLPLGRRYGRKAAGGRRAQPLPQPRCGWDCPPAAGAAAPTNEGCLHPLLLVCPTYCKSFVIGKSFVNYA